MFEPTLSSSELASAVSARGYPVSVRQLERWREADLLTSSTLGVDAKHAYDDIRRCIAIKRCLDEKDHLKNALYLLWAAGFEVKTPVWRRSLSLVDPPMAIMTKALLLLVNCTTPDSAMPADLFEGRKSFPGVLGKIRRLLGEPGEAAAFAGTMFLIGEGESPSFSHEQHEPLSVQTKDALLIGLGLRRQNVVRSLRRVHDFNGAIDDAVCEKAFKFDRALENALLNLSDAVNDVSFNDLSDAELCSARDDCRNILKAAFCFYHATEWIYGRDSFGLRISASIAKTLGVNVLAGYVPIIARLRRIPGAMISSADIATAAEQAEAAWLMSRFFYTAQKENSQLQKFIGPTAFKSAFRDSVSFEKLLTSLSEIGLEEPVFQPWALWKSVSSTKKMPNGLLAMSIGSPDQISQSDLVAKGRGDAIR